MPTGRGEAVTQAPPPPAMRTYRVPFGLDDDEPHEATETRMRDLQSYLTDRLAEIARQRGDEA